MLPDPLHPAVVHLPIAFSVLLPVLALVCVLAIRRAALPARAWLGVVGLAFALVASAWLALETGEEEEERVEAVVAEQYIEAHEEAAEQFMVVSVGVLIASLAGLLGGSTGRRARGATVVLAAALLAVGVQVGHRGGALVYEHGAAAAYTGTPGHLGGVDGAEAGGTPRALAREHHEDDDD